MVALVAGDCRPGLLLDLVRVWHLVLLDSNCMGQVCLRHD